MRPAYSVGTERAQIVLLKNALVWGSCVVTGGVAYLAIRAIAQMI